MSFLNFLSKPYYIFYPKTISFASQMLFTEYQFLEISEIDTFQNKMSLCLE